jgi:hypothetical protein
VTHGPGARLNYILSFLKVLLPNNLTGNVTATLTFKRGPMTEFVYREASSFDFSNAPTYRKTSTLDKSQVETAATKQEVVTVINGKEETRNTAEPGDKIITGVKGERYVIGQAKFGSLYEEDPSNPARYISKNVILALPLSENTELTAPWGEKQRALKGGVVAQRVGSPSDVYLIDEGAFKATYSLESSPRPAGVSAKATIAPKVT